MEHSGRLASVRARARFHAWRAHLSVPADDSAGYPRCYSGGCAALAGMCQLPSWLVQLGRQGEALEVLLLLRDTEEDAHEDLQEIIYYEASLALGEPRRGERLQSDVPHEQRM